LDSLAKQTLSPELFEVVVVDDGSTDASADKIRNFKSSFALKLVQQRNAGVSAARNAGAASANTPIIAFLDNDATADARWLENALLYFEKPECLAIEGRIEARGGINPPTPFTHVLQNETGGRYMTCNMIFRKKTFDEVGGFDSRFPYFLEDSDLAFSILERGYSIHYARDVVVYHPRIHKPFRYHWWQMTGLAFRIPLLFAKHPEVIRHCRKYGIPWHTMTACPVYFYGYYAAVLLAAASLMAPLFFPWPLGMEAKWFGLSCAFLGFLFSYAFTLYARLRKRAWVWREVWPLLIAYLVIPYARVYWLVRGAIHFRVRYPFP
ncbi:glycosyltransferase, partial [bacterium]|nr:glycosyltransferase [bacterium]